MKNIRLFNDIKSYGNLNILRMDETATDIVNTIVSLSERTAAKASKGLSFADGHEAKRYFSNTKLEGYEKDAQDLNEAFMRYCVEGTPFQWTDISMVRDPQVNRNRGFQDRLFAIVGQAMTPVAPAVVSTTVMNWAEVKDIALGDTADFTVESNELFEVNEAAEGIMFGPAQRLYKQEFTVNPTMKEVTVDIDWFWVATNKMDWGSWAYKIGLSFGAYINKLIYKTLKDAIGSIPAAYKATGWSDTNFLNIAKRVQLANNGASCYVFGTKVALGSVVPSSDYFKFQLGEEWTKVGYIGRYRGYDLMEMDQVLVPSTVNTTATFGIDDDYLWFFPLGGYKPVKIVFEGGASTYQKDSTQNFDKTQTLTIQRKFAAKAITGSRYGYLTI